MVSSVACNSIPERTIICLPLSTDATGASSSPIFIQCLSLMHTKMKWLLIKTAYFPLIVEEEYTSSCCYLYCHCCTCYSYLQSNFGPWSLSRKMSHQRTSPIGWMDPSSVFSYWFMISEIHVQIHGLPTTEECLLSSTAVPMPSSVNYVAFVSNLVFRPP